MRIYKNCYTSSDQLIENSNKTSNKLQLKCQDFIEKILEANWFNIQFVIEPADKDNFYIT